MALPAPHVFGHDDAVDRTSLLVAVLLEHRSCNCAALGQSSMNDCTRLIRQWQATGGAVIRPRQCHFSTQHGHESNQQPYAPDLRFRHCELLGNRRDWRWEVYAKRPPVIRRAVPLNIQPADREPCPSLPGIPSPHAAYGRPHPYESPAPCISFLSDGVQASELP